MKFTEKELKNMRDMENEKEYKGIVAAAQKIVEARGDDFYSEFIDYASKRGIPNL